MAPVDVEVSPRRTKARISLSAYRSIDQPLLFIRPFLRLPKLSAAPRDFRGMADEAKLECHIDDLGFGPKRVSGQSEISWRRGVSSRACVRARAHEHGVRCGHRIEHRCSAGHEGAE